MTETPESERKRKAASSPSSLMMDEEKSDIFSFWKKYEELKKLTEVLQSKTIEHVSTKVEIKKAGKNIFKIMTDMVLVKNEAFKEIEIIEVTEQKETCQRCKKVIHEEERKDDY